MSARPKILLVDDEQMILDGLSRTLRGSFEVRTATSGAAGLALLAAEPGFAIVMSDMRMPQMNGATFLARAAAVAPDAVRLLLTGQADMEDTIAAINEGHIFRFLRKPCPQELMRSTLAAAAEQHRLVTAERELLEQTLRGAVEALCQTLALASPGVFGAATRVKRTASAVAAKLGVAEAWPLEVAAMVSELGAITLPAELYERRAQKEAWTPAEREMLDRIPAVTDRLLAPIPRLEPVRAIIRECHALAAAPPAAGAVSSLASRVLRAAIDFDDLEAARSSAYAIERMRAAPDLYGTEVFEALASLFGAKDRQIIEVEVRRLREGMVIASDILSKGGVLLVARGHEVTPSLLDRLRNFLPSLARDTVAVFT
jgi:CheY-like chemotaxis protein